MIKHRSIKSLGQVFLKNENIKKKIANFINSSDFQIILEIGPGLGAITEYIDKTIKEYWAIEIDKNLFNYLVCKYLETINIVNLDFLKLKLEDLNLNNKKILIFGNVPYYISSSILLKFLKTPEFISAYFMFQKEFVEMMVAKHKTNNYSFFSVLLQTFCEIKKMFSINRINFFPKPKIDSIFISLNKKNNLLIENIENYMEFLKICFSMPRKTLFNNLKNHFEKDSIIMFFKENDFHLNIRSEEISPQNFELIFSNNLKKHILKKII